MTMSAGASDFATYRPATGEPFATYPVTTAAEVSQKIAKARASAKSVSYTHLTLPTIYSV